MSPQVYSLYMDDIDCPLLLFIPLLDVIIVNATPTAIFCMSCMNYLFLFSSVGELGAIFIYP